MKWLRETYAEPPIRIDTSGWDRKSARGADSRLQASRRRLDCCPTLSIVELVES